jgi:endonuclease III
MIATGDEISAIIKILKDAYPDARIALTYNSTWELLVAVILSAQCTDKKVNEVTRRLFAKYPHFTDYLNTDIPAFENDIKSTGFFHNKAKNILATAKIIQFRFGGQVPETMQDILTLPGVARKTANIVLGNAYQIVEGIAVDTHVSRISQRLRLVNPSSVGGKKKVIFLKNKTRLLDFVKDADSEKIEKQLMQSIPKPEWFFLTYRIIDHGRLVCKAQKPLCVDCPLNRICPVSRK